MGNHNLEQKIREKLLEWRSTLEDVNVLYENNTVPQSERLFKNGWGCINDRDIDNLIDNIPKTINELKQVPGIGPTKLNKYGDSLVQIINSCIDCQKNI